MLNSVTFSPSQDGQKRSVNVSVGDKILVPEYGGTKVTFEKKVNRLLVISNLLVRY